MNPRQNDNFVSKVEIATNIVISTFGVDSKRIIPVSQETGIFRFFTI